MTAQRTLKNTIRATGIGLHSGRSVVVTLKPAPVDTGVVFTRVDLAPEVSVAATIANVGDTHRGTTLVAAGAPAVEIVAVGHIMSALLGLAIDNVRIELDGPEVPVMDGSAAPFVFLIQSAGAVEQATSRRYLRILKETTCTEGGAFATLAPHDGCRIEYRDDVCGQRAVFDASEGGYIREVSRARTFGVLTDLVETDGGGDAAPERPVLAADAAPGAAALRLDDEFARHKILDAMGDLYLTGHPMLGRFLGCRSGHTLTTAVVRAVLADAGAYEIVSADARPAAHA